VNFIEAYGVYSSGNEAPPIYHKWAGISTLSSLLSRRVWVSQGFFTVYPNLYILFVGNPGNGKSTAMKISRDLVRQFPKTAPIAPASITREALTKDMGDEDGEHRLKYTLGKKVVSYTHMSVFANELVTLLGVNPIGMVEFLTDIWDEEDDFKVKTKNKGTDFIPKPCVTLLGCMTPETTNNLLKESIISGGFARRCIFVYANRRGNPVPRPETTVEQKEALACCLKRGAELAQIVGEFQWTDDAIVRFDSWYCENHEIVQDNTDLLMNGYFTSKNTLVLKVAMMLALSESSNLILNAEHIDAALELLGATEKDLNKVFEGTGRNPEATIAAKILAMVESQSHAINEKLVFSRMYNHGNDNEITAALHHLQRSGSLVIDTNIQSNIQVKTVGTPEQIAAFRARGSQNESSKRVPFDKVDLNSVEGTQPEEPV